MIWVFNVAAARANTTMSASKSSRKKDGKYANVEIPFLKQAKLDQYNTGTHDPAGMAPSPISTVRSTRRWHGGKTKGEKYCGEENSHSRRAAGSRSSNITTTSILRTITFSDRTGSSAKNCSPRKLSFTLKP